MKTDMIGAINIIAPLDVKIDHIVALSAQTRANEATLIHKIVVINNLTMEKTSTIGVTIVVTI